MLFVLASLLASASAHAAEALKGVALVIGNGDYEHLGKLPNPENDADEVERLLGRIGFDTTATADRDARRLKRDLEGFAEDAQGADIAVLYYSGHGIEAGGRNYLVPVDADLSSLEDAGESLVAVDALIEKLKAEVPIVIVFLDACRNNPFPADAVVRLSPGGEAMPIAVSGLGASRSAVALNPTANAAAPDANVGTILAFAAEPGRVALDGDPGGHSPYAAALLRHLSAMTGDEFGLVMRMVGEEVYLKTQGQQRPWVNESMRRLLYLGQTPDQPTGAEGDILTERRGLLVTIAALPDRERRTIETVAADTGVPMDALYGMLKALGSEVPQDPAELDTLLRSQTEKVKAMIAERDTLKSTDPEIVRLSALADEALAEGALNTAIDLRQQAKARARQVESTVEDAEAQLRERRIELAEVYAKSAESYALAFKHREAAQDYEEAARQIDKWDEEKAFWYTRSAATAYLEAGKLRGGAPDLERAAGLGQDAAEVAERLVRSHPENREYWEDISAQTLNNLANAYSSLYGATKQKKALANSIETYERVLKVLSRERVPEDWVLVQNNLAGSLMMLGETESGNETLERSIAAFQAALTVWTRDANPQRWAIVISNLGNAQGMLAKRKNDIDLLRTAIASLDGALEVQTQEKDGLDWAWTKREAGDAWSEMARFTHDEADLKRSVASSQEALKVYTLARTPRLWAQTMHDMAVAYIEGSTKETRKDALRISAAIYEQIIAAITPDEQPVEYTLSAGNLGSTDIEIGTGEKDQARIEAGIARLREVVALYKAHQRPDAAANNLLEIGGGLVTLGNMRSSTVEPQQAIDLYRQAIDLFREAGEADQAKGVDRRLAYAETELGYQRSKAGDLKGAVEAYQAALDHRDRDTDTANWLFSANQIAIALHNLGAKEEGIETLAKAVTAYRVVADARAADPEAGDLAETRLAIANVLRIVGERTRKAPDLLAAADAFEEVAREKDKARSREGRDLVVADSASLLLQAAEATGDPQLFDRAASTYRDALKIGDMPQDDRVFHTLNFIRALFFHANAGAGDAARKEAVEVTDANWPLFEKSATAEQRVNVLLDRANLLHTLSLAAPESYPRELVREAYGRAAAIADLKDNPSQWRSVQQAIAEYDLNGIETPDFPAERLRDGLGELRALLDATPRQTDPQAWAELANWYGYALSLQGKRENRTASFEQAVPLLRDALSAFESADNALSAAHTRDSLCSALVGLGRIQKQRALVAEGEQNCSASVAYMRANNVAQVIPIAEANLAEARQALRELGQP